MLALLREEFPDISISKIRFLETEGLLDPARTPAGYRLYTTSDIERLRYILTAQRDRFWPLKVIREALDGLERGLTPAGLVGPDDARPRPAPARADPDVPAAVELRAKGKVRLTSDELSEASACAMGTVEELRGFGLLRPDAQGYFGDTDAQVAAAAGALAAYGIEPRHLRAFKAAADREVGLVEQALVAVPTDAERDRRGAEIARLCLQLHAALVKAGLAQA